MQKIFDLAAKGTGLTAIVRYLNENSIPTPIQYARAKGLTGNYDDGNGSWNTRSVKYILTNRTYTGMLVHGKEKRAVEGTHESLVDNQTLVLVLPILPNGPAVGDGGQIATQIALGGVELLPLQVKVRQCVMDAL